ncbi:MAG: ribose-phosphate pyrophosphokinase [Candidatus Magasanikbacteria bacterium CG10_big_fil_rev_8_21_14_0_10_40_10]|uniref:ribose-phosphate diphosphokinase n=1 Tax=Candidatus Magasanikbacteria bacterium CG10_big_fil_rev_8_21_14_0_10_40_10 TaxID=1974648 RepID=A0A2M6W4J6_9BACT|nr:MAG: ribose-phosphate pyrophosphokinase [Candidatus Magasanikbacteria bacterium CG10_big_fil_rev_8_21_14_0_10_40_10]
MNSRLKVFSGSSHPAFAQKICRHLNIELGKLESFTFTNDNRFIKINEAVRGCDVFVIQTSYAPVDVFLMEYLMLIRALKGASASRITAVMPYFPYARSDKKDQARICLSARLVADLLETAGADRILIMEMHSPQLQGFFSMPCDHLLASPTLIKHIKQNCDLKNYTLVAADAGAAKTLKIYADGLKLPMAIMDKRRDGNDDQPVIKGIVGNVQDKKVMLIDDEISSGRTLVRNAEYLLNKAGAISVDACVTHAVLAGNAAEELAKSPINKIIVTDTMPNEAKNIKGLEIVSVSAVFADCIKRIYENESIKSINDIY